MKQNIKTVIFDFDYTIADSSVGSIECINHALAGVGLPAESPPRIRSTIGLSLNVILEELTGRQSPEVIAEFLRLFMQRANEIMADKTLVYSSVPTVIGALIDKGLHLGLVSTKFRYRIQTILRRDSLLEPFDVIVGGEDVTRHKPDPEGLLLAIEKLGTSLQSSVYVGDSVTDAETARRAGVSFVAVLTGVTPAEAFADYPVDRIIADLSELPEIF
jgi:phosphoglycolate phosphatase